MEITVPHHQIENLIYSIRGTQVMLDSHLAELYRVETRVLNQAVKRNLDRFPETFRFQLASGEWETLRSQFVILESKADDIQINPDARGKHKKYLPHVFTEQGVAMLSAVLRSETAVKVSIQIMNAFVAMRKSMLSNASLFQRLDIVELKLLETDQKFEKIFKVLESRYPHNDKGIFFEGQIFDAYTFVSGLIRSAGKSIILIDNYIDETVLTLFSKRKATVEVDIYTQQTGKQLLLDVQKHNAQYPAVEVHELKTSHDRFLIIDQTALYHIGASLKDLGKKWFAFSRMDSLCNEVLNRLKP